MAPINDALPRVYATRSRLRTRIVLGAVTALMCVLWTETAVGILRLERTTRGYLPDWAHYSRGSIMLLAVVIVLIWVGTHMLILSGRAPVVSVIERGGLPRLVGSMLWLRVLWPQREVSRGGTVTMLMFRRVVPSYVLCVRTGEREYRYRAFTPFTADSVRALRDWMETDACRGPAVPIAPIFPR